MPRFPYPHQNLSAARTRLTQLRERTRGTVEWCVALLILGGVLWLIGSRDLAFSVAAGAVAAVVTGALAEDERRRLLLGLVVQGDATSIPEVRALADRLANDPSERRRVAKALRTAARANPAASRASAAIATGKVAVYAPRMLALADTIADEDRVVTPRAVALCRTLLCDGAISPLYNVNLPESELDRALAAIEAGIAAPALAHEAPPALAHEATPALAPVGVRRPAEPPRVAAVRSRRRGAVASQGPHRVGICARARDLRKIARFGRPPTG